MDIALTEEERLLQQSVRAFVERELPRELVRRWDEEQIFDESVYRRWAELGWLGLPFPAQYGGGAASPVALILVAEELGRRGYDLALNYTVPVFCGMNLLRHGAPALQARFLPALARGDVRFAIAITEPNAGSDVAALECSGRVEGDRLVLNGNKVFSSGSHRPSTYIMVACRTAPGAANSRAGISVALVPNDVPGLEISPMRTLGRHLFRTNELFFRDVQVPLDHIVGPLHGGWKVLTSQLELERALISATYVGNAQAVVDDAVEYARSRKQFGRPIGQFQAIAHMLADAQVDVDAARLLTYRVACLLAREVPCFKEASMAKLFSSEALVRVVNHGMQVMGGYGYTRDFDMERHFRAARVTTIAGGSSQVQRNLIAREMGL